LNSQANSHESLVLPTSLITGFLSPGTSPLEPGGAHHHSGFKCQIVSLSSLCAMSLVQLYVSRESIQCFTNIVSRMFLSSSYNSCGPSHYYYDKAFIIPHSLNSYTYLFIF